MRSQRISTRWRLLVHVARIGPARTIMEFHRRGLLWIPQSVQFSSWFMARLRGALHGRSEAPRLEVSSTKFPARNRLLRSHGLGGTRRRLEIALRCNCGSNSSAVLRNILAGIL